MLRPLLCILLCALLALPAWAAGPPTKDNIERAASHHQEALTAFKRGKYKDAIAHWSAAEALHPTFKYSFNLASAYFSDKEPITAFKTLERARTRGLPPKYEAPFAELDGKIRASLRTDHAMLRLRVTPSGATVTLQGLIWQPPWQRWVTRRSSKLEITHPGFVTITRTWNHAVGGEHALDINMAKKAPELGTVEITGSPTGASVELNGRKVGALPFVSQPLKPGRYLARISALDHAAQDHPLVVVPGRNKLLDVHLKAVSKEADPSLIVKETRPVEPPNPTLAISGWVGVGLGVALAGVATGLFVHADGIVAELKTLDQDPGAEFADYQGYLTHHALRTEAHDQSALAGWISAGVGSALLVTGVVLLAVDAASEPAEAPTTQPTVRWLPWLTPDGAGAAVGVGF